MIALNSPHKILEDLVRSSNPALFCHNCTGALLSSLTKNLLQFPSMQCSLSLWTLCTDSSLCLETSHPGSFLFLLRNSNQLKCHVFQQTSLHLSIEISWLFPTLLWQAVNTSTTTLNTLHRCHLLDYELPKVSNLTFFVSPRIVPKDNIQIKNM